MKQLNLLAFDLGASSGRGMLGRFDGERLTIAEAARFENRPVSLPDGLYWDALRLFSEMKDCLRKIGREQPLSGIGIDAWGVDFGLLDAQGGLIANPRHYRDRLTADMPQAAFAIRGKERIYQDTGLAFISFNSLYQLYALARMDSPALKSADRLLFMPDLFGYFLSGEKYAEATVASTSQMINPHTGKWVDWLDEFGIRSELLPPLIPAGTVVGSLLPLWREETDLPAVPIIATAGHDTASAVAAVPALSPDFTYISSGTWSLFGCESASPILSPAALAANYTNEGGAFGTVRVLKNVMGLWLIQECKREWDQTQERSFSEISALAEKAPPFLAQIDVDAPDFFYPGDMPEKIAAYSRRTGQNAPETVGEFARVVYESLALKYRWVIERQREITGIDSQAVYIVGGGSRNALLNRLVADCLHRAVYSGPSEATAIGNLLMQAAALGEVKGLSELREIVLRSFPPDRVDPDPNAAGRWDDIYLNWRKALVDHRAY